MQILLPVDVIVADKFDANANTQEVAVEAIPDGWMGLDIGPKSVKIFEVRTTRPSRATPPKGGGPALCLFWRVRGGGARAYAKRHQQLENRSTDVSNPQTWKQPEPVPQVGPGQAGPSAGQTSIRPNGAIQVQGVWCHAQPHAPPTTGRGVALIAHGLTCPRPPPLHPAGCRCCCLLQDALADAKTVVWNGPMGVFEFPKFANGTVVSGLRDWAGGGPEAGCWMGAL